MTTATTPATTPAAPADKAADIQTYRAFLTARSVYGPLTAAAVDAFEAAQKRLGYSGADVMADLRAAKKLAHMAKMGRAGSAIAAVIEQSHPRLYG